MANLRPMKVIKTTIAIGEETWNEFKKIVSLRYGSSRVVSHAVEEAIRCFNAAELLKSFSGAMGIAIEYPSIREVEERRPKLRVSAGEEVRGIRDERQARLSGFEQHCKEVR